MSRGDGRGEAKRETNDSRRGEESTRRKNIYGDELKNVKKYSPKKNDKKFKRRKRIVRSRNYICQFQIQLLLYDALFKVLVITRMPG